MQCAVDRFPWRIAGAAERHLGRGCWCPCPCPGADANVARRHLAGSGAPRTCSWLDVQGPYRAHDDLRFRDHCYYYTTVRTHDDRGRPYLVSAQIKPTAGLLRSACRHASSGFWKNACVADVYNITRRIIRAFTPLVLKI